MSYVLYFDLADWLAAIEDGYDERIYVQPHTNTRSVNPYPLQHTAALITLTAEASDRTIHAARIVVERGQLMEGDDDAGMRKRLVNAREMAEKHVAAALPGAKLVRGVMMQQGMSDDLETLYTSHKLWTVEQPDKNDRRTRRLVPLEEPANA